MTKLQRGQHRNQNFTIVWENLMEKRNGHYASVTGYLTMLFEGSGGKKGAMDFLEKLYFVDDDAAEGKAVVITKEYDQPFLGKGY